LDHQQRNQFLSVIEQLCHAAEKTLVYVSHYREEIPACVTKILKLEEGKVM
jgi:molybdate transport system ATP-binding protein